MTVCKNILNIDSFFVFFLIKLLSQIPLQDKTNLSWLSHAYEFYHFFLLIHISFGELCLYRHVNKQSIFKIIWSWLFIKFRKINIIVESLFFFPRNELLHWGGIIFVFDSILILWAAAKCSINFFLRKIINCSTDNYMSLAHLKFSRH